MRTTGIKEAKGTTSFPTLGRLARRLLAVSGVERRSRTQLPGRFSLEPPALSRWLFTALVVALAGSASAKSPRVIYPQRANEVAFSPQEARFVRLVILSTTGAQTCIDELEVYGPQGSQNLAAASRAAHATASSCLAGYAQHRIEHLNDEQYGNDHSWIPAGKANEWACIELARSEHVSRVVFSRDRRGEYVDRIATHVEVQLSPDGRCWQRVAQLVGQPAQVVPRRRGQLAAFIPPPPPPPRLAASARVERMSSDRSPKVMAEDNAGFSNLARGAGTHASASSAISGYPIHQVGHLNDGQAGNDHSWVAASTPAWAEIDLGRPFWVYHVAFGNDSAGRFRDRAATSFSILAATEYARESSAPVWNKVYRQQKGAPVYARRSFKFPPVHARWIRVAIESTNGNAPRIDELEVFGQSAPIPLARIGDITDEPATRTLAANSPQGYDDLLHLACLAEEHAWLKTNGYADLSSRLVPYNGRVQHYPRHVAPDVLPLPPLSEPPALDGNLDDPCWRQCSRGVARVAFPYDDGRGPLVEISVRAGHRGDQLYLGLRTDQLLSGHLAVVSSGNGQGAGVLMVTDRGLVWKTFGNDGAVRESKSVPGDRNDAGTCYEVELPLDWFPECRQCGLRIGLGMGGKHTRPVGQPIHFEFAPLAIAEAGPCLDGSFRVRLTAAGGDSPLKLTGNTRPLDSGIVLKPGQERVISVAGEGPIGPQLTLDIQDGVSTGYQLHLFRYDPLQRTIFLMRSLVERLAGKGIDVARERRQVAELVERQAALLSAPPHLDAERQARFDAYVAKRRLFFRNPELAALGKILFVKRHAFEPSHNYSVLLDAAYRPGGGVCLLAMPWRDGRLQVDSARLTTLFDAGGGIARNPMANFDLSRIFFGYRPSAEGYYHIVQMDPDGTHRRTLTSGPFHDYWPCPLPDGGLAFISTRCRARFLCWRPQAAVLFRMDADGANIRPLSFANLTEWGPSVMDDGRIIWQRSEYVDKGADFSHTLWAIRPDGTHPELVFGNDIIQPNGYANGHKVPDSTEFLCTLISHFGDLNGPLALVDPARGRFNPGAITSLTPEVPWPGMWPREECFRDGFPVAHDYFLCAHAPRDRFGLYVIDRFGNREILYLDPSLGSMGPTLFRPRTVPPVLPSSIDLAADEGEFFMADVYRGIEDYVPRGQVKYLRVCQEVRADLEQLPDGSYRRDHPDFQDWYATPTHKVRGPYGWPSYVAKASLGLVPVESDGSARFYAPAGKVLYFEVLDEDLNELQRMRSVVQLQPGERRGCVGCHEPRNATPRFARVLALQRPPRRLEPPPWGAVPFSYEEIVQPVWNRHCIRCHDAGDLRHLDFTGTPDADKVPASYRTLISQGWVHYLDYGWNSGGNEKRPPLTFGTLQSKLWKVLDKGHYDVKLTREEQRRIKCWTDLNCPLWPDYKFRGDRPGKGPEVAAAK